MPQVGTERRAPPRKSLRASLAPAARRAPGPQVPCEPLLDERGARVILGAGDDLFTLAAPVAPSAQTMFGPRGACAGDDGSLWISDTGHHRVLGWRQAPAADGTPADIVLGQPAFDREGRNARGSTGERSMNVPTGITPCGADGRGLAVADAWNHRVLIWTRRPVSSGAPPDIVLGQPDFEAGLANRGADAPTASTLFWPYCVAWDGARLWVADTGNRRVLMWHGLPRRHAQPADLVLGQPDFAHRDENGGAAPGAASMRWPHAISFPADGLCIADAGNNRLMLWHRMPTAANAPCDVVAGQNGVQQVDHNQASYYPDAACLNMPYGATVAGDLLVVADTANSRLLAWRVGDLVRHGVNAVALAAQHDWNGKGDNRWLPVSRASVCWPYAVALLGADTLLVADSGNNRVLLWSLAVEASALAWS